MASLPPTTAAAQLLPVVFPRRRKTKTKQKQKRALTHLVLVKFCYFFPLFNLTFLYYFLCKTIFKNVAVVVTCSSYSKHPTVIITISDYSRIKVQITLFFILLSYLRLTQNFVLSNAGSSCL